MRDQGFLIVEGCVSRHERLKGRDQLISCALITWVLGDSVSVSGSGPYGMSLIVQNI